MFLLFALFSHEPEVFLPKYSQTAVLHAAHLLRVVNLTDAPFRTVRVKLNWFKPLPSLYLKKTQLHSMYMVWDKSRLLFYNSTLLVTKSWLLVYKFKSDSMQFASICFAFRCGLKRVIPFTDRANNVHSAFLNSLKAHTRISILARLGPESALKSADPKGPYPQADSQRI